MKRLAVIIAVFAALCFAFTYITIIYRGSENVEGGASENVDTKRKIEEPKKILLKSEIKEVDEKPVISPESSDTEKDMDYVDVDYFDSLTDKWMDSNAKVSIKDVEHFVQALKRIAKERQAECVQRALNLIPDENIMLLAGILADKTMDKEIIESVFSDILNRDENVKTPILEFIFKDKSHPCWADTAWILDVTGQLPKEKK